MLLWRISGHASLSGLGGELSCGRWHTAAAEKRVVYLAEHPAVALIENLVNLTGVADFLPDRFQLVKITRLDTLRVAELTPRQRSSVDPANIQSTQRAGDDWLASSTSAMLRVPSIPVPESWNYLLNPLHSDASSLHIEWARPIAYDKRLFRLRPDA